MSEKAPRALGPATDPAGSASLELVLGELVADAEHLLDLPYLDEWLTNTDGGSEGSLEVIEGPTSITVLVEAPGYTEKDFWVKPKEAEIEVRTPEFRAVSRLPAPVDTSSARLTYRNGILSIVLAKVF